MIDEISISETISTIDCKKSVDLKFAKLIHTHSTFDMEIFVEIND
jgi:hypothetical protein